MRSGKVLLVGTLDTKGAEIAFVRDRLRAAQVDVSVLDAGCLGRPTEASDSSREKVFEAAGVRLAAVQAKGDRGEAVALAAKGAAKLASQMPLAGVLAIGGSAGSTIGSAVMRALPYGLPKILVSTLASGQVGHYVGEKDIVMMYSVVDFCGLNRFSRRILANAADAMIGMVKGENLEAATDRPMIASTMFGVTTPCVERAKIGLEAAGYETLVFHATGSGGRTMEGMIRDKLFAGVLDITTTELADELVGGVLTAGEDRLTAAAIVKVPQVISVGALDMVNFGPVATVPEKFADRRFHQHNANVTLMRTTPRENDLLGKEIAQKACAAGGKTTIILPLRGVSAIDQEGCPFWWPEADQALFQSVRNWINSDVKLIELDLHINDPAFADEAVKALLGML